MLTWENGHAGWNMASWNCCPAGEPTTSDFLLGLEAGGVARGYYEVDEDKRTATVVSEYGGKSATLTIEREERAFDWLNVALEVYGVDDCDEFAGLADDDRHARRCRRWHKHRARVGEDGHARVRRAALGHGGFVDRRSPLR